MSLKGMLKMEFYIQEDYLVPNGFFQDGLERYDKFFHYKKTNKQKLHLKCKYNFQILGSERICYAKENSTVDPTNRIMTLFTQNVWYL